MSTKRRPQQRKAVDLIAGSRPRQAGLTIDILKERNRLTDEQLDQPIPEHKLFDIARLIPNWYEYAGTSGLELDEGDKLSVSTDGRLYDNSLRAQRALEVWHKRNPYAATYRCILNMCLQRRHGNVAVKIVQEVIQEQDIDGSDAIAESALTVSRSTSENVHQSLYDCIDSEKNISRSEIVEDVDETSLALQSRKLMKIEFSVLYTSLRLAMKVKSITGSDLISHLVDMEMFGSETEPLYNNQDVTLRTAISSAKVSPSLDNVFHLMAPYCSWFNHLLIESIIDTFFSDNKNHSIHKRFAVFKQKFCDYCKDRKDLVDHDFGSEETSGTTLTIFKIDRQWDNIRIEHLPLIVEALADALKVRKHNLILRTVNNGCLELNIAMSNEWAEQLFPLQQDILPALRDFKVLKYEQPPWSCNIDSALEGIEESGREATRLQRRLRLLPPGHLAITAPPLMHRLLPFGAPTLEPQTLERIRLKALAIKDSPGAVTGLMLAYVGEQAQSELISLPEERPLGKAFRTLELFGYYIAGGTNPWYSIPLGLGVLLCSSMLRYIHWRMYRHNLAIKQAGIVESCESVGIFLGSAAASMFCHAHGLVLGENYQVPLLLALFYAGGATLGKFVGYVFRYAV